VSLAEEYLEAVAQHGIHSSSAVSGTIVR
jgi:hypothetical protein